MTDIYTVNVIVKPYVARYLVNNCGDPVDLSKLPKLNNLFRSILRKSLMRHESLKIPDRSSYVSIIISKDTFYRYGWDLTRTDMMYFNAQIEKEIKFIMRNYVSMRAALGFPVAKCIRDFQCLFNMPEDVWSFDAIKKDIDRHTATKKDKDVENFIESISRKMNRVFVENLSNLGTVSNKFKNELSEI